MHGDVINDVREVGNDKSDADDDDHVVFARNVSGHSLTDCPIITWRTFITFHWVTKFLFHYSE